MTLDLLQVITSTDRRGAEIFALDLGAALRRVGDEVETVALAPGNQGGLSVRTLGRRPLGPGTLWNLRRAASHRDMVIAHGSSTLPACASALPSVSRFVYRNIGDPAYWIDAPAKRWWVKHALQRASAVAALSSRTARAFEAIGVAPEKIHVIPNAVPGERCRPLNAAERDELRREAGVPIHSRVAACVGSLTAEKRVDVVIEASMAVDDLWLLVVGDGPERARLAAVAAQHDPTRVVFIGPTEQATRWLGAADVLIQASRTEGMPAALIEAGLLGVPAVATDVGDVREVVVEGLTGVLVPLDAAGVSEGVRAALSASGVMGREARRHCLARFEMERVAELWRKLLDQATNS